MTILKHVVRNALIPVVTLIALRDPGHLHGRGDHRAEIFRVPGIGSLLISSILANDTPVIMAITFVFSCLVVLFNLAADLLYGWLDPRISYRMTTADRTVTQAVPAALPRTRRHAARSLWQETWRRFRHHRLAIVGATVLAVVVVAVVAGPFVYRVPINEIDFKAKLQGPSRAHPLGTDDLGQDSWPACSTAAASRSPWAWPRC